MEWKRTPTPQTTQKYEKDSVWRQSALIVLPSPHRSLPSAVAADVDHGSGIGLGASMTNTVCRRWHQSFHTFNWSDQSRHWIYSIIWSQQPRYLTYPLPKSFVHLELLIYCFSAGKNSALWAGHDCQLDWLQKMAHIENSTKARRKAWPTRVNSLITKGKISVCRKMVPKPARVSAKYSCWLNLDRDDRRSSDVRSTEGRQTTTMLSFSRVDFHKILNKITRCPYSTSLYVDP